MRSTKNMVAALVVATGFATCLTTVAPATARADDQLDQTFLQTLKEKGVRVKSGVNSIAVAHSTCDLLAGGATTTEALKKVKSATGLSAQDSVTFGGLAVYAYCKQYLPK